MKNYLQQEYFNRYSLDEQRLLDLVRFFYAALMIWSYWLFVALLKTDDFSGSSWLWPVAWLDYFNPRLCLSGLFTLLNISLISLIVRPSLKVSKLMTFLCLFFLLAANYSFGKIDSSMHGFLYTSFIFAFFNFKTQSNPTYHLRQVFFFSQLFFVSTYFLAGLWKIRGFFDFLLKGDLASYHPLAFNLSFNQIQSFQTDVPDLLNAVSSPWFSILWTLLVVYQVGVITLPFFPRWQRAGGVSLILFHMAGAVALDVYFAQAAFVAMILFVMTPYQLERSADRAK